MEGQPRTPAVATPRPASAPITHYTWERLEDQLQWYDLKSAAAQRAMGQGRAACPGGRSPIAVASAAPGLLTALLGGFVVVLEGVQQLYQWQTNWVLYRSTNEALKHEKFLYLAQAGPYSGAHRQRVLAERVEGLVSQEHAKWTDSRHQPRGEADGSRAST